MAVRSATYAPVRPVPYLLERGYSSADGLTGQRITCPVRSTGGGDAVVVTESGSTITVEDPGGTELVSAVAITGLDSDGAPYYDFAAGIPDADETEGSGWNVAWSLVIAGEVYTFRMSAILCDWVPMNLVTAADLYTRIPALRGQIPPAQRESGQGGDGTGWAPQIDEAYYAFIRHLMSDGRPIWTMREPEGYREWILTKAAMLASNTVPAREDGGVWATYRRDAYQDHKRARAGLRLQFDSEAHNIRRAGELSISMLPVGRPLL